MNKLQKSQSGFALVEGLLLVIAIALVTFVGYYVWHSQKNSTKTSNDAVSASQSTASPKGQSSQKYLVIKEWGIRIPYSGGDTYSYKYNSDTPNNIELISNELATKYGCTDFGAGIISKLGPDDPVGPGDTTAKEAANQSPNSSKLIDGYYYSIVHDQASCSDTVTADSQNQVNEATIALTQKIEAIPQ